MCDRLTQACDGVAQGSDANMGNPFPDLWHLLREKAYKYAFLAPRVAITVENKTKTIETRLVEEQANIGTIHRLSPDEPSFDGVCPLRLVLVCE